MSVEFIWFDLGYTLLYKEREKLFGELLKSRGISRAYEDIDKAFHLTDKLFMRSYPGLLGRSPREFMPLYFGFLSRELDLQGDLVSLLSEWTEAFVGKTSKWLAYPWVDAALDALGSRGLRLGVISNWDPSAREILRDCGILDKFEAVVISSEVGVSKPDARIFRIGLEGVGLDASRCLYVGDNYYDDSVGAGSVGMPAVVVNRFGRLGVEELQGCAVIRDVRELGSYLEESA